MVSSLRDTCPSGFLRLAMGDPVVESKDIPFISDSDFASNEAPGETKKKGEGLNPSPLLVAGHTVQNPSRIRLAHELTK